MSLGLLKSTAIQAKQAVLVELFTSQGCSSCPSADKVLYRLFKRQPVKGVQIIALGEHIDYWNYLGWRDTFSSSQFNKRQKLYANYFQIGRMYTPQMLVDGRYEFTGHRYQLALKMIKKAARQKRDIVFEKCSISKYNLNNKKETRVKIKIKALSRKNLSLSSLYFAIAEKDLLVPIKRGENMGKNLRYVSVTRYLKNIAYLRPSAKKRHIFKHEIILKQAWRKRSLLYVAFFQRNSNGHILNSIIC